MRKKLPESFFADKDVVKLAQKLLGKRLCTFVDGIYTSGIITETEAYAGVTDKASHALYTSGIITETEAYAGVTDKASHAYGGRKTDRTKIMFEDPGTA